MHVPQFNVQEILEKLKTLGVRPNKKLGQNFLVNTAVCEKIVNKALSYKPSEVVEVGPGLGALTHLIQASGLKLQMIELDRGFCEYWKSLGFTPFHEDALVMDWARLQLKPEACLISNLPYQISASLVIDRSINPQNIQTMVLMFQKEVAQRIMAKPKTENYGMLTIIAQSFWNLENLCEISSKDFYPPPQVASRVVVFRRKTTEPAEPKKYLSFVKVAFSQRRKFLISNLSAILPKDKWKEIFEKASISETVRAEELSIEQFQKLYSYM